MRILYLISTVNPEYGGPVEGLRQMVRQIQFLGHYVEVATLDNQHNSWKEGFTCPVIFFGPSYFSYGINFRLIKWLRQNSSRYDRVIVNGIWQFHGFATWIALKNSNIPYHIYIHGMLDPWFKKAYPLKHVKKFLYWVVFERFILKGARSVFFITEEEKLLAAKNFFDHSYDKQIVGFGIKGQEYSLDELSNIFYEKFPTLRNSSFFLFVGRIHPKKGCDLLIDAFSKIGIVNPHIKLLILGPDGGSFAARLRAKVDSLNLNDSIIWGGMVADQIKWGAYAHAHAFILPSHSENFGAVVPEALSANLPVLITNKVNIWREVVIMKAGLVGIDTPEDVLCLLEQWLRLSDHEILQFKINSRVCFDEFFSVKTAAEKLIKTLST